MRLKKILTVTLCLAIVLVATACGGSDDGKTDAKSQDKNYGELYTQAKDAYSESIGKLTAGTVGDSLSNSFFNWTVNSVETKDKVEGKTAKDGYKFIVANISVTNTTKETFAVGNYDFIGITEVSEDGQIDTMDSFYDKMYPDEKELAAGKTLTGDLVFQVKEDVNELIVDYQVFYQDESTGDTNWVCLKF